MTITTMHAEDVKAELRKKFGTMTAFERANDLPHDSVSDFLRRKRSKRVQIAIEAALSTTSALSKTGQKSGKPDNNPDSAFSHPQNAKAA